MLLILPPFFSAVFADNRIDYHRTHFFPVGSPLSIIFYAGGKININNSW